MTLRELTILLFSETCFSQASKEVFCSHAQPDQTPGLSTNVNCLLQTRGARLCRWCSLYLAPCPTVSALNKWFLVLRPTFTIDSASSGQVQTRTEVTLGCLRASTKQFTWDKDTKRVSLWRKQ